MSWGRGYIGAIDMQVVLDCRSGSVRPRYTSIWARPLDDDGDGNCDYTRTRTRGLHYTSGRRRWRHHGHVTRSAGRNRATAGRLRGSQRSSIESSPVTSVVRWRPMTRRLASMAKCVRHRVIPHTLQTIPRPSWPRPRRLSYLALS